MKPVFLILSIVFVSFYTNKTAGQAISDSFYNSIYTDIRPVNKTKITHQERIDIISHMVASQIEKNKKEALQLVEEGKQILDTTSSQELKVKYAYAIGCFYVVYSYYNESPSYFKKVIEYAKDDTAFNKLVSQSYAMMASIYSINIEADSAVVCLHNAIDKTNPSDSITLTTIYDAFVTLYKTLDFSDSVIRYVKKYTDIMPANLKWDDDYIVVSLELPIAYNKLYLDTKEQKYADSSLVNLLELMQMERRDSALWYSPIYYYLGQLKYYEEQYHEAIMYYDSCLLPVYANGNFINTMLAKHCILEKSLCLIKTGHPEAIRVLETLQLGKRDFFSIQGMNRALYDDAKIKGNWKDALMYYERYVAATDSLDIINTRGRIFEANQQYSVVKKEATINSLEKEKLLVEKKDNKNKAIAIVIVLALIITILLIVWYYKQQQLRKEQQIAQLDNATQLQILELEETARTVRVEERKKMGMDLHDTLAGTLAAIKYKAEIILLNTLDESQQKELRNIISLMGDAYEKARNKSHELYKSAEIAEDSSFSERIKLILKNTLPGNISQKEITIDDASLRQISLNIKIELLQIIKESVTNILKHAKASKIELLLYRDADEVILIITDDGKGFDLGSPSFRRGLGMKSIYHRVKEMDGKINVSSAPGEGTELNIVLPIPDENYN